MSFKAKSLLFVAIGLLLAHYITAQDCLAAISDDKLALACTNNITDTVSFNGNDTATWDAVLSEASNSTSSWQVVIQGVNFINATSSIDRLLTLLSSAPDNSTVSLSLNECTMEDEKYINMQAYTMPAASYSIQIANSTLAFNNLAFVNILGFPTGVDVSLGISESVIASNNVTMSALVGSLADAFLTINIDDASDVSENMLGLSGVVGVAGDGGGGVINSGSTINANTVEAQLMLAFGGNASWTAEGIEEGSDNSFGGTVVAVPEQPLVQIVLDLLTSLSSSSSLNTTNTTTTTLDITSLSDIFLPMLKYQACSTWAHLVNMGSPFNITLEVIEEEKQDTLDDLLDDDDGDDDDDDYDDDDYDYDDYSYNYDDYSSGGLFDGLFDGLFGGGGDDDKDDKDDDPLGGLFDGLFGGGGDDDKDDDPLGGLFGGFFDDDDDDKGGLLRPAPFLVNDTMTELLGCPSSVADLWNDTTGLGLLGGGGGVGIDIGALLTGLLGNGTTNVSNELTALLEGLLGNGTYLDGEKSGDGDFNGLFGNLGGLFGGGDVGGLREIFDDLFGGGWFGDDDKGVGGGGNNWFRDLFGELGLAPALSPAPVSAPVQDDDGTKL